MVFNGEGVFFFSPILALAVPPWESTPVELKEPLPRFYLSASVIRARRIFVFCFTSLRLTDAELLSLHVAIPPLRRSLTHSTHSHQGPL
jgi:hypothetical protein